MDSPNSPFNIFNQALPTDLPTEFGDEVVTGRLLEIPGLTADHIRITLKNNHFEESGPFRAVDGSFRVSAGFQVYTSTANGQFMVRYESGMLALGREFTYLQQVHENWVGAYREVLDIAHFDTELTTETLASNRPFPVIAIRAYLRPLTELARIAPLLQPGRRSRSEKFSIFYPAGITRKERKSIYMQAYAEHKRALQDNSSLLAPTNDPTDPLAPPNYERILRTKANMSRTRREAAQELTDHPELFANLPFHIDDRCMLIHGHSRFRGEIGTLVSMSPSGRQAVIKLDMGITVSCRITSLRVVQPPPPSASSEPEVLT